MTMPGIGPLRRPPSTRGSATARALGQPSARERSGRCAGRLASDAHVYEMAMRKDASDGMESWHVGTSRTLKPIEEEMS